MDACQDGHVERCSRATYHGKVMGSLRCDAGGEAGKDG